MLAGVFDDSIIGRATGSGVLQIALHNPRDYTDDRHHVVDDYAYGGGPGMVMKPEPLVDCVDAVRAMAEPRGAGRPADAAGAAAQPGRRRRAGRSGAARS